MLAELVRANPSANWTLAAFRAIDPWVLQNIMMPQRVQKGPDRGKIEGLSRRRRNQQPYVSEKDLFVDSMRVKDAPMWWIEEEWAKRQKAIDEHMQKTFAQKPPAAGQRPAIKDIKLVLDPVTGQCKMQIL